MESTNILLILLIASSVLVSPVCAASNFPMQMAIEGDNVLWLTIAPPKTQPYVVPVGKDATVFIRSDIDSGSIFEDGHPFKGFLLLKTPPKDYVELRRNSDGKPIIWIQHFKNGIGEFEEVAVGEYIESEYIKGDKVADWYIFPIVPLKDGDKYELEIHVNFPVKFLKEGKAQFEAIICEGYPTKLAPDNINLYMDYVINQIKPDIKDISLKFLLNKDLSLMLSTTQYLLDFFVGVPFFGMLSKSSTVKYDVVSINRWYEVKNDPLWDSLDRSYSSQSFLSPENRLINVKTDVKRKEYTNEFVIKATNIPYSGSGERTTRSGVLVPLGEGVESIGWRQLQTYAPDRTTNEFEWTVKVDETKPEIPIEVVVSSAKTWLSISKAYAIYGDYSQYFFHKISALDFLISATSEKGLYGHGNTADLIVNIKSNNVANPQNIDLTSWVEVGLTDDKGKYYKIFFNKIVIPSQGDIKIPIKWNIPSEAIDGNYKISVTCWRDEIKSSSFNDNLKDVIIFRITPSGISVLDFKLIYPINNNPANAGIFDAPVAIEIKLSAFAKDEWNTICLGDNDINFEIGGKGATIVEIPYVGTCDYKLFKIMPPLQKTGGNYDLKITMKHDNIIVTHEYNNIIVYKGSGISINKIPIGIAIDRTGSMQEAAGSVTKLQAVKESVNHIYSLSKYYGNTDKTGVVSFNTAADVIKPMTGQSDADTLAKISNLYPYGDTSFGAGLATALTLYDCSDAGKNAEKFLIFMSDGKHNTAPSPSIYLPQYKECNIKIYTIGYGDNADETTLKVISDTTGGAYYKSANILELENKLIDLFDKGSGLNVVNQYQGVISQGEVKQLQVPIPPNQETAKISLNWPGSNLGIELYDPANQRVDLNRSDIIYSGANSKPKAIIITNPVSGTWIVRISGLDVPEGRTDYSLDVKSIPRKAEPTDLQRQVGLVFLVLIGAGIVFYIVRRQ